jgi:hypothetical protein
MDSGNAPILCGNDIPDVRGGKVCPTSSGNKKCFSDRAPVWSEAQDGSRANPETHPQDLGVEMGGSSYKGSESPWLRGVERLRLDSRIPARYLAVITNAGSLVKPSDYIGRWSYSWKDRPQVAVKICRDLASFQERRIGCSGRESDFHGSFATEDLVFGSDSFAVLCALEAIPVKDIPCTQF